MEWAKLILSNLTGIAAIITLVLSLVTYVRKATKEKNWSNLLATVTKYMEIAEEKFDNGADRKEWVLAMVKASAETINYNIDMNEVAKLIDDLCKMTKVVNAPEAVTEKQFLGTQYSAGCWVLI